MRCGGRPVETFIGTLSRFPETLFLLSSFASRSGAGPNSTHGEKGKYDETKNDKESFADEICQESAGYGSVSRLK